MTTDNPGPILTYRVELRPNREQADLIRRSCDVSRFTYNWVLERCFNALDCGERFPSWFDLSKELNALKANGDFEWMYGVSKHASMTAVQNAHTAFIRFFRHQSGRPKWKRKKDAVSYVMAEGVKATESAVWLPRIGWVRLKERGYLPPGFRVRRAAVRIRDNRYFLTAISDAPGRAQWKPRSEGEALGIDLGVRTLATLSDGRTFENPKHLEAAQRKLRRLNKALSRSQRNSKRHEKARQRLARQHYRVACQRKDAIHKMTSEIVARAKPEERPRAIIMEDLDVEHMRRRGRFSRRFRREIGGASFGEIRRQLAYKSLEMGIELQLASRWYPSSKTCSSCGAIKPHLHLSSTTYDCSICGESIDRDLNAALNLRSMYVAASSAETLTARGEDVRPAYGRSSVKREGHLNAQNGMIIAMDKLDAPVLEVS